MHEIKVNGKNNLLDLNIHSENFFAYLLNIILDSNLINANKDNQNIEGIDLIDASKKQLIQVTSTCTKQKIESTLRKYIIRSFKKRNFTIQFIFIDDNASNLKKNTFHNPHEINFNPKKDIFDLKDITKMILYMEINKQKLAYDLVKDELGEELDLVRVDSNLTEIINTLSKEDLGDLNSDINLDEFFIDEKIQFNNLNVTKDIIEDYKVYHFKVDEKYKEFDKQAKNKSHSIFHSIQKKYLSFCSEKDKNYNEDQIFLKVIDKVIETVQQSKNYIEIPIEELEMCVSILVVDAFIRCKIFKNPKGYSHVTS